MKGMIILNKKVSSLICIVSVLFLFAALLKGGIGISAYAPNKNNQTQTKKVEETTELKTEVTMNESSVIFSDMAISEQEIRLIALLTMAEAEGECEEGKRLVIDTVLNRMDSKYFPDTVYEVVYQPNQFTSMWTDRVDRCEVRDDICRLVHEEVCSRTNYDVVFFTAGRYSDYGEPLFRVGNHYFSSYSGKE